LQIEFAGGVLEGLGGGGVGTEFRIEVPEDSDANGVTHGGIVLERVESVREVAVRSVVRVELVVAAETKIPRVARDDNIEEFESDLEQVCEVEEGVEA
jgi:hypothetical protein